MFKLKIVTPKKIYLEEEVAMLNIKAYGGDMGLLAHHSPLVAVTEICEMTIVKANQERQSYAAGCGVLKFENNSCLLLLESIESPSEIDANRAKAAMQRAEAQMANIESDKKRAMLAKARAKNRLKVVKYE